MKTNLGRLSFRAGRVQAHIGRMQFFMLLYLTMDSLKIRYSISFWWGLLVIPAVFLVHYIDKKWILPKEVEVATTTNPEWGKLMGKIDNLLSNTRLK